MHAARWPMTTTPGRPQALEAPGVGPSPGGVLMTDEPPCRTAYRELDDSAFLTTWPLL